MAVRDLASASLRWPTLGVLAMSLLQGLLLRENQRSLSEDVDVSLPTASETLLSLVGEPHLIAFFLVPVSLALATAAVPASADYPVVVRHRSSAHWLWWGLRTDLAQTVVILAAVTVGGTVTSVGLSATLGPLSEAAQRHDNSLAAIAEQPGGDTTSVLWLVAAQLLLLGLGLLALRTLLALVYLHTHSLGLLVLTGVALWVATVLSFRKLSPWMLGPMDGLTLYQAVQLLPWWATAAIPAAAILALLCVAAVVDKAVSPRRAGRTSGVRLADLLQLARRPWVLYGLTVVAAVSAVAPQVAASATSPWDVFLVTAWGTSSDDFATVTFSVFLVVFVGFAYLVSVQLESALGDRLPYVMIRHRSMAGWTVRLLLRSAGQAGLLLAGLFALTAGLGHLLVDVPAGVAPSGVMTSSGMVITMSPTTLYQFAVNGVLQLVAYSAGLFLVMWWRRSSAWALGTVAAIAVLSWPGANAGGWVPVGLNSIAMLTDASAARMTIELVVLDVVLVAAAVWSVTRSGTTVHERS